MGVTSSLIRTSLSMVQDSQPVPDMEPGSVTCRTSAYLLSHDLAPKFLFLLSTEYGGAICRVQVLKVKEGEGRDGCASFKHRPSYSSWKRPRDMHKQGSFQVEDDLEI